MCEPIDIVNLFAIESLERLSIESPSQSQIDAMESALRDFSSTLASRSRLPQSLFYSLLEHPYVC